MNIIKMIVGLSNPTDQYNSTRHNIGGCYIQLLAQHFFVKLVEEKKFLGFTAFINIDNYNVRLLMPNIFMNINGRSVYKMASFYNISLEEILIAHDDLDILAGHVKLTYSYGHGGHNGMRNVISKFGKKINFHRLRIGIGRPKNKNDISSFVLSNPTKIERNLIKQAILYAIDKTLMLITTQKI